MTMLAWNNVSTHAAPTDRVILISNGWTWRREDVHFDGYTSRGGTIIRPPRDLPSRHICGGALLVHWQEQVRGEGKGKGAFIVCGSGALAPPFSFWIEINNPITADDVTAEEVVTNLIPEAEQMPHYHPSVGELRERRFRQMVGL